MQPRRTSAFSLVEVSMAIAVAAFAFTALLGLIPSGLTVFRNAIDSSNESWIVQNLNSMVQVTDWEHIDTLDHDSSGEVYYFDEEGRLTDTKLTEGNSDDGTKLRRLYGAKLLIEPLEQPGDETTLQHGRRVIAVIANITQPPALKLFEEINSPADLSRIQPNVEVRARSFLAAQMAADQ